MDLETENRIAAILMKEAAELRRQADKDGIHVYLQKPNVRGRPNSRFLTATVLGVQQANKAEEIKEMWRLRQKEQELDEKVKGRDSSSDQSHRDRNGESRRNTSMSFADRERTYSGSRSSRKRESQDISLSDEEKGLRDEELEEFLQSRAKRGRGAVGSRMDETGPYLPPSLDSKDKQLVGSREEWENRVILGPQSPSSRPYTSSEEDSDSDSDSDCHRDRRKEKAKKVSSSKKHSRKHKSREKSRKDKKKRKEERRRKSYK